MYKMLDYLSEDARAIREEVFVKEQGLAEEYGGIDDIATHVIFYDADIPIATGRYYQGETDEYIIGRFAVRVSHRKKHLGKRMLEVMESSIREKGGTTIKMYAQLHAKGFYEKCGYVSKGDIFLEQSCEHIYMEKKLS